MRFGITILPDLSWAQAAPLWRDAEALGFDHAWTYDHLVWGGMPESTWYGTVPTLTAAATVTSRIGLGTFVTSPNFRHPATWLREVQSLDDISGGRFLCGIGSGGDLDSRLLGGQELTMGARMDRFVEFTETFEQMLSSRRVDHAGQWYTVRDMPTLPGPIRERVPLLIAANGSRGQRFAARVGDGWITYGRYVDSLDEWWAGVAELAAGMNDRLAAAGRTDDSFRRVLNLDPVGYALTSASHFEEQVGRAHDLGFTDVVTHWPRDSEPYQGSRAVLEEVAAQVLPRWRDA
ncbi:LLM class flavin-dependent oxidoreductase [Dermacoccaceae bacterium W4C1]